MHRWAYTMLPSLLTKQTSASISSVTSNAKLFANDWSGSVMARLCTPPHATFSTALPWKPAVTNVGVGW